MTQEPKLIALTGFAQSGKSTVAEVLLYEFGYRRLSFADPIKRMLSAIGLTQGELYGDFKEIPSPILQGRTPRHVCADSWHRMGP